jgi:hypothetical protein
MTSNCIGAFRTLASKGDTGLHAARYQFIS